jgi:putative ABC transport system permease protein
MSRRTRHLTRAVSVIGVMPSRLRLQDAIADSLLTVSRSPLRTVLTSVATILAVGTAVAAIGLAESAAGAVSGTFNALEATVVVFVSSNNSEPSAPTLAVPAESALDRLHGVIRSGLEWQLGGSGLVYPVSRTPDDQGAPNLPVTAASAGGLGVIGARVYAGRLYDVGMDRRADAVGLLGYNAAVKLGITGLDADPVIYVGGVAISVIGLVSQASQDPAVLNGVIVPDSVAPVIDNQAAAYNRQIIVRTLPGAAQLVGRQGAFAIDPLHPQQISAEVPTDPAQLRNSVDDSITILLLAIAGITLCVGIVAIANTTVLSVIARRSEFGLRRSLGAAPRHIAALVLAESAITGLIGGFIGTSVGALSIAVVCAVRGWIPVIVTGLLATAPVVGAAAGLVAGLYPAWRASRVTPIQALRS